MLLVRSHGQLGNQVFHLLGALSARRPGEKVVLFGFGELAGLLSDLKTAHLVIPIPNRFSRNLKFLERALRKLARRGRIGRVFYGAEPAAFSRTDRKFLPTLFDAGNAQNFSLIKPEILAKFFEDIDRRLTKHPKTHRGGTTELHCFVHIRRGDYLAHPSVDESIAIPDSWFLARMASIAASYSPLTFRIYSDDVTALSDEILRFPGAQVRNVSDLEAFDEMAQADMGILSASTFSWWSAIVADHRGATGPFIGPQHWAGWRHGVWEPEGFWSEALTYVEVGA